MINVVTFKIRHNKDLPVTLAGSGIRLITENSETAEEFLEAFSVSDINIDAALIGNSALEGIDKKRFFDSMRESEPNIRIIIVFPGYRNEYIEEQIAEYKNVYGIPDIIYEGMGLDEVCVAETIKKGYIYNYDVNVYDEKAPAAEPIQENKSCVSIGVMGITRGAGVTNMTVSIAEYTALSQGINVKAVDFSDTGSMRFAKSKKVTYILNRDIDIRRIARTSRAVVYDFGTPFELSPKGKLLSNNPCYSEERIDIFRGCDLKILMCFSDVWHFGKIKYFINDKLWKRALDESYLFLFDKAPEKLRQKKMNIRQRNDKYISERINSLFISD